MSLVLIDSSNCYICREQVFSPRLEIRPVLVLSSNDHCVGVRSSEVKALGVKMPIVRSTSYRKRSPRIAVRFDCRAVAASWA
jgi:hypothetical protein